MKRQYNETETSRELTMYIENTGALYRSYTVPTIKNLEKKYKKGTFDEEKAVKAFCNIANIGAKMYAKEFATPAEWNRIFSVSDRKATAAALLEGYLENINGENPLQIQKGR